MHAARAATANRPHSRPGTPTVLATAPALGQLPDALVLIDGLSCAAGGSRGRNTVQADMWVGRLP
jgi:hypothetical protein